MVQFGLDQVAASSAQLRGEREGTHPVRETKGEPERPLIYPLPSSLIPRRLGPRAHLSVCVGRALVELFMTGLIGLIEDIKITCQPRVSGPPSQSDDS